jgi:hypothetical protein
MLRLIYNYGESEIYNYFLEPHGSNNLRVENNLLVVFLRENISFFIIKYCVVLYLLLFLHLMSGENTTKEKKTLSCSCIKKKILFGKINVQYVVYLRLNLPTTFHSIFYFSHKIICYKLYCGQLLIG